MTPTTPSLAPTPVVGDALGESEGAVVGASEGVVGAMLGHWLRVCVKMCVGWGGPVCGIHTSVYVGTPGCVGISFCVSGEVILVSTDTAALLNLTFILSPRRGRGLNCWG
eukprot:41098-Eustigmatos_ZCMA.PRE.1